MPVILCNCLPPVPSGTADGDILVWDGSEWVAQQPSGGIDSGTSFPGSSAAGDVFYRTDLREIAYYDGTRWVGDIITIPMINLGGSGANMTSTGYVYFAPPPADDLLLVRWDVSFLLQTTADASNYWTYRLAGGGVIVTADRTSVTTGWTKTSHALSYVLSSSANIMSVYIAKTGNPGTFSFVSMLFARRILN